MIRASKVLASPNGNGAGIAQRRSNSEMPPALLGGERGFGDVFVDHLGGQIVVELLRRVLAEIGRGADQCPAFTALERNLGAADRVHHAGRRIGAVFHREAQFQFHRHVAPLQPFEAQEAQLVVLLPGNIVRRADVDVFVFETLGEHRLHRASVTWSGDDVDLRIGRQRIAWGTGRFFSALDRFNPFSPTSLERAERPGVDAVLAVFRAGALSNASAVFVPQRSPGSSIGALRWHDNAGAADYSLMIGQFAGASVAESVVGADLATQVGDAGLRAELAIVRAAGRIRSRVLVGMDRAIGDKVTVGAEIYRDGSGAARRKDYDYVALFAGRVQTLARHYLGVFGDVEITPLVKLTVDLIANLDDGSHVISPSLSWSLRPDIDLSFGAQRFAGRNGSEYGSFNDLMFVRLQWHF